MKSKFKVEVLEQILQEEKAKQFFNLKNVIICPIETNQLENRIKKIEIAQELNLYSSNLTVADSDYNYVEPLELPF